MVERAAAPDWQRTSGSKTMSEALELELDPKGNGRKLGKSLKRALREVEVLREEGYYASALTEMRRIAAKNPEHPLIHGVTGTILHSLQRIPQAHEHFWRGLYLDPENDGYRMWLAHTALSLGQPETILDIIAAAREPNAEPLPAYRAGALRELERHEEAESLAREILDGTPSSTHTYRILIGYGLGIEHKNFERGLSRQLARKRWSDLEKAQAQFLLADLYHLRGDYEQAWQTYEAANRAGQRGQPEAFRGRFNLEEIERRVDHVIKHFPRELIEDPPEFGLAEHIARPALVLGLPRAGKSMLEQQLEVHPQVYAAAEMQPFERVLQHILKETGVQPMDLLRKMPLKQRVQVGNLYLNQLQTRDSRGMRVTDTNPANLPLAGFMWAAVPGTTVILVERDPVDVAFAYFTKFLPRLRAGCLDPYTTGRYVRSQLRLIDFWRDHLPTRCVAIRYEDLVRRPEAETGRVLEALELPWDEACRAPERETALQVSSQDSHQRARPDERFVGLAEPYRDWLDPLLEGLGEHAEKSRFA